ncbi:DinB family protein [Candidatus Bathyarchaeota archaeon]|nr:DinB family protein [Candidatus Bathyarchaeota archaeon]MBL7167085.1 DinB family protein [Candidatus Bathyarchaeota archaeon]
MPYKKALEGIRPELRGVRPDDSLHSIYEELEHMRICQEDLLYYAIDPDWESPEWPSGLWPTPSQEVSDKEWDKTVNGFFRDMDRAVEMVKDQDIDLLSVIPGSDEYTYLREVVIIIEHNAYHLGKILDIRKALDNWR